MNVVVVGGRGQLGRALVHALRGAGHHAVVWDRPVIDIADPHVTERVAHARPDAVVNAAALTNVDGAEQDPASVYAANALGPRYLAEGCARCGAFFLQVSTNEVFAGAPGRFYYEHDEPQPGGVYARSKLAGERAAALLCPRLLIVRVAWLFGPGGTNFPTKIVAAADRHGALRIVDDEWGNPTYAPDAAAAMVRLLELERCGIFHLVNDGYTSRYGLAAAVLQGAGRGEVPLTPIPSSEWPRAVQPPAHAVLVNQAAAALGVRLRPWEEAVAEYAATLAVAPAEGVTRPALSLSGG